MYKPNIIQPKDRQAWLQQRQKGIGSSDIATIVGCNPYDTPYSLWARRLGYEPDKEETPLMRQGHSLELAVADMFEHYTQRPVIASSAGDWMYQDPTCPHFMASPDRLYWRDRDGQRHGPKAEANKAILECKSTQKVIHADDIPTYWFVQVQWQLAIGGKEEASLAWLSQWRDFGWVDIHRNEELIQYLKERADEFWRKNILEKTEPDLYPADQLARYQYQSDPDKTLTATAGEYEAYNRLSELSQQIKELKEEEEIIKNNLKLSMGLAERLVGVDGELLVSWKSYQTKGKLNTEALKTDHPELYQQYVGEPSTSRRFLVK